MIKELMETAANATTENLHLAIDYLREAGKHPKTEERLADAVNRRDRDAIRECIRLMVAGAE